MKQKLTKIDKDIALLNGISYSTVYRRLKKGWTVEKAITIPTDRTSEKIRRSSLYNKPRGKLRSFKLPLEYEDFFEQMCDDFGLTALDMASEIVTKYLRENQIPG